MTIGDKMELAVLIGDRMLFYAEKAYMQKEVYFSAPSYEVQGDDVLIHMSRSILHVKIERKTGNTAIIAPSNEKLFSYYQKHQTDYYTIVEKAIEDGTAMWVAKKKLKGGIENA